MKKTFIKMLTVLGMIAVLTACGSSGGGDKAPVTPAVVSPIDTPVVPTPITPQPVVPAPVAQQTVPETLGVEQEKSYRSFLVASTPMSEMSFINKAPVSELRRLFKDITEEWEQRHFGTVEVDW